jgi:Tol biopolymer transport system component
MGEVYEARDTRLKRRVAVKVLPPGSAGDVLARERFAREAHAISALNHPNICTLHDVGSDNGVDYLVMEMVEGESLAQRIARGALPVDEVKRIAGDIARALAKAHSIGIIHRDLKPGNVMLTKSGAKLLDFGLARRAEESPASDPHAQTVVAPLTAKGLVVGTLQYMAPEQLAGGLVDARSDVYALGAVMYEMATGRRASDARVPVPAPVDRLVEKCLQRDPDERWQCAGDVELQLREDVVDAPLMRSPRRWIAAAALLLGVIAGGAGAALFLRSSKVAPAEPLRLAIAEPAEKSFSIPLRWSPVAVTRDGLRAAIVGVLNGESYIWVRDLGSSEARRLEATAGAQAPFWSPDGKSIGFFSENFLRTIAVESGAVTSVCSADQTVPSASWGSDGTIIFSQILKGILAVPSSGGTPRILKIGENAPAHLPEFFPDGRRFFFVSLRNDTPALYKHKLWVGFLDGSPPQHVGDDIGRVTYVPPYIVYARDGVLVARKFDEATMKLTSDPVQLAPNVLSFKTLDTSANGAGATSLLFMPGIRTTRLAWFDRNGSRVGMAGSPGSYWKIRLSPDGRRALALASSTGGVNDVWAIDNVRNLSTRLTFNDNYESAIWSPDAKSNAFTVDRRGPPSLYVGAIGGTDNLAITPQGHLQAAEAWIPSSDRILYSDGDPNTQSDLMIVSTSDKKSVPWRRTPFNERGARVSPDGKWVAYVSNDSGRDEVYVAPLDHSREQIRISSNGGNHPAWRGDGRELFYLTPSRELFSVKTEVAGGVLSATDGTLLFSFVQEVSDFDVAADGQRILAVVVDQNPATQPISVIVGWQEIVERALAHH